jgi:subtilisin family serine protease
MKTFVAICLLASISIAAAQYTSTGPRDNYEKFNPGTLTDDVRANYEFLLGNNPHEFGGLKANADLSLLTTIAQSISSDYFANLEYTSLAGIFKCTTSASNAAIMSNDSRVLFVESDTTTAESCGTTLCNLPGLQQLDRLDQTTKLRNGTFSFLTASYGNVKVAVFDSSVNASHPEFAPGQVSNVFTGGTMVPTYRGHGTRVASTIGGTPCGTAPGVPILSYDICNTNAAWTKTKTRFLQAYDHLVSNHNFNVEKVIVVFAWTGQHVAQQTAQALVARGALVAVASGRPITSSPIFFNGANCPQNLSEVLLVANYGADPDPNQDNFVGYINSSTVPATGQMSPVNFATAANNVRIANDTNYLLEGGSSYSVGYAAGAAARYWRGHTANAAQVEMALENSCNTGWIDPLKLFGAPNRVLRIDPNW